MKILCVLIFKIVLYKVGMETIPTPLFYSYLTVESGSPSNQTFRTNLNCQYNYLINIIMAANVHQNSFRLPIGEKKYHPYIIIDSEAE